MRGIEQIADDNIPLAVCSALLEVIPIRNVKVVMAVATGLLRTIRDLALCAEGRSIESSEDDLGVLRGLGKKRGWKEEDGENA